MVASAEMSYLRDSSVELSTRTLREIVCVMVAFVVSIAFVFYWFVVAV
jgi:hypothetical protein